MSVDLRAEPLTDVAGVIMANGQGRFLLQRRDNSPTISSPNRIGMFGGHKEPGEEAVACALREVEEETGLRLEEQDIDLIVATRIQYANGIVRAGTFFFADGIDGDTLTITEGRLEVIPYDKLAMLFHEMVPTTAYVMALLCEEIATGKRNVKGIDRP